MHILSPEIDNFPSCISGRERMTVEKNSTKECSQSGGGRARNLLITSGKRIKLSRRGWLQTCVGNEHNSDKYVVCRIDDI